MELASKSLFFAKSSKCHIFGGQERTNKINILFISNHSSFHFLCDISSFIHSVQFSFSSLSKMIQLFCLQDVIALITQLSFQYYSSCIAYQFINFYTLFYDNVLRQNFFQGRGGEWRKAGEERRGNGDK